MVRAAYTPSFRIKQHPLEDAGIYIYIYTLICFRLDKSFLQHLLPWNLHGTSMAPTVPVRNDVATPGGPTEQDTEISGSPTVDGSENPANQLRLVVYPIIWRVLYIPGGAGILPSTVCVGILKNFCPSLLTTLSWSQEHLIFATQKWRHTRIGFATPPWYRDVRRLNGLKILHMFHSAGCSFVKRTKPCFIRWMFMSHHESNNNVFLQQACFLRNSWQQILRWL